MEIDTTGIPSAQPMNREGVAQVIRLRSYAAPFRLQSGELKELAESAAGSFDG